MGCREHFNQAAAPPSGRRRTRGLRAPGRACDARSRRGWPHVHGHMGMGTGMGMGIGHAHVCMACTCTVMCMCNGRCACHVPMHVGAMAPQLTLPLSWWLACPLQAGCADVSMLHNVFKGEGAAADRARHAVRTPGRRSTPALVRRGRRRHRVCLARVKMTRRRGARRARTPAERAPCWRAKFIRRASLGFSGCVLSC